MIHILTSAPLNTVQDHGRPHAMGLGVTRGGAMDPLALTLGNALLGNALDAAAIEIVFYPFRCRFEQTARFAITGAHTAAELDSRPLPHDWCQHAKAGQTLTINRPTRGTRAYLTVAGGIDVPSVLGARATDLKAGFGGFQGRGLQPGDRLPIGQPCTAANGPGRVNFGLADPLALPEGSETTLRVLPAAEYASFTEEAHNLLTHAAWTITPSANRTGYRLEGDQTLRLKTPLSLFSHGIVPGTIQVPGAGQPIVQMADANTCGGYPKIATIVQDDLRLLAQSQIGARLRFRPLTRTQAHETLLAEEDRLQRLLANIATQRQSLLDMQPQGTHS